MGKIISFTDLTCWQEAHKLAIMVYEATKSFPREEAYGLTSQIRRAAVSVTSNIAEGFGRTAIKEKLQFYSLARGSLIELQNQLLMARDVSYMSRASFVKIADQSVSVHKLLNGFIVSTNARRS